MPKIYLKHKSPEFDEAPARHQTHKRNVKICDMEGCSREAEHRAPKDRSLDEYWNLCLEHARDYNKAWDFFSGMSETEAYHHMMNSALWDRPTWSFKHHSPEFEDNLRHKASHFAGFEEGASHHHKNQDGQNGQANGGSSGSDDFFENVSDYHRRRAAAAISPHSPEGQALEIMGLSPPISLEIIKKTYKDLMKKHHPDLTRGNKDSEDFVKKVNMAYTTLKMSYTRYKQEYDKEHT